MKERYKQELKEMESRNIGVRKSIYEVQEKIRECKQDEKVSDEIIKGLKMIIGMQDKNKKKRVRIVTP